MAFEIVQIIAGNAATLYADRIEEMTDVLGMTPDGTEDRKTMLPCLQGKPRFAGYIGPCYAGEVNGVPVIRYEDQQVRFGAEG